MFKRNFNHFREFDDVVVVSTITPAITVVMDPVNDKEYKVPTHLLTPTLDSLF